MCRTADRSFGGRWAEQRKCCVLEMRRGSVCIAAVVYCVYSGSYPSREGGPGRVLPKDSATLKQNRGGFFLFVSVLGGELWVLDTLQFLYSVEGGPDLLVERPVQFGEGGLPSDAGVRGVQCDFVRGGSNVLFCCIALFSV